MENIPYFEDPDTCLRPGVPIVERETINAVLWNPKQDEFLCLDWREYRWKTFIVGGVDKGEKPLYAATREIEEETGYKNMELIADLGRHKSGYYAEHKGENRIAPTTAFLFRLVDNKQSPGDRERLPHIPKWIPRHEVESFVTPASQKYLWRKVLAYIF